MANKSTYNGLSFVRYKDRKTLSLKDKALVKQDILNHISTRLSERIMMPDFGTRISDMPFEPLDKFLLLQLKEDLTNVVNYDPRVELIGNGITITPLYEQYMIVATIELFYIEFNLSEVVDIKLQFEN